MPRPFTGLRYLRTLGICLQQHERDCRHEKNFPTKQPSTRTYSRVSCAHVHRQRPQSIGSPSGQRSSSARCINHSLDADAVATFTFTKATRLLTPFDYKQVFAAAALRVSTKELLILARSNQLDHARLGIVVAKKNVRRATQRNRIKRITRETFRLQQHQLIDPSGGIDAIVLARSGLGLLDNAALHKLLNQLWQQLQRKANKQATE